MNITNGDNFQILKNKNQTKSTQGKKKNQWNILSRAEISRFSSSLISHLFNFGGVIRIWEKNKKTLLIMHYEIHSILLAVKKTHLFPCLNLKSEQLIMDLLHWTYISHSWPKFCIFTSIIWEQLSSNARRQNLGRLWVGRNKHTEC